jgi:hypothetical protein
MRSLLLPAALVLAAAVGASQDPQDPDEPPPPRPVKPGPKKDGPADKADGPAESPRLKKLKQISFDRRPSAIFKAWAPPPKADGPAVRKEPLDEELAAFQKNVTLGKWDEVKKYLASLPDEEAVAAYEHLLEDLRRTPTPLPGQFPPGTQPVQGIQQFAERNSFTVDDVVGLAACAPAGPNPALLPPRCSFAGVPSVVAVAPAGLTKEHFTALASILREAIAGGTLPEVVVKRFKEEVAKPADKRAFTDRQAARLLADAGEPLFIADFLPKLDEAQKANDLEALNLLSRHFLAKQGVETETGNLEKAWAAVQAVLAVPNGAKAEQEEALLRAVELAPRLKDKLGEDWLNESFTKNPDRGMQILATVGTLTSRGLTSRPNQPDDRLNGLKLMKTAIEALLKASPERAREWRPTLTLLAAVWLREAEYSRENDQSTGPRMRRDIFGIMYLSGDDDMPMRMGQRPDMPQPIMVRELIKTVPSTAWVEAVDAVLQPRLAGTAARLHLKVNEEDKAFPMIEKLAATQPVEARELVREFLRVWTRNHNMNEARNEFRRFFFFGFEQRAEGIPLTRSKQERNLQELAKWAERIRKLPGNADLDEELLVKAFTACHSTAEVYRTEAIVMVFGPLGQIKPRTLAALAQQMRENLAGLWRDPNEQAKKKTNRRKKDIESEVLRGYEVALQVVRDGLEKFPDHWALLNAQAGIIHDEINFRQELNRSADFSARRSEAFAIYQRAADSYAKAVTAMPEAEHTTTVYEHWFSASLGAVDLGMISEDKQPDWTQPPRIRKAIESLPGDLAKKHLGKFATSLFVRMSAAKPHVKFNYLKAGFMVVNDDDEHAAEAKKLFDYYKDLVTEIKLDVQVDGPVRVGHGRAFGVFVNLRHTRDIERESGGFGRYLQNQNSMPYAYNYGRPNVDYKDRFEASARAALKEHFEVISVSFQDDKVTSRADREFGWRYTPYAYILLKPRGPQVDRLPPLRIDLDFLDTSGFMILPVESPAVHIDCHDAVGDPRPLEKLTVTQTLDERQADKGILLLEIKATGVGLIPELNELCEVNPDGFVVDKVEDQGLAVKKFEEDLDHNAVVSERVWMITLKGREGLSELPRTFRFPAVKLPAKEVIRQRYNDADLASVPEEVTLDRQYGQKSNAAWWWLAAGVAFGLLVLAAIVVVLVRRRPPASVRGLPENLDPFVAAALLREIRERPELSEAQRSAIDRDLDDIERHFFSAERNGSPAPDLRRIVERWAAAAPGWGGPQPVAAGV